MANTWPRQNLPMSPYGDQNAMSRIAALEANNARLRAAFGEIFDTLIEARNSKCSEALQEAIDKAALMSARQ